MTKNENIVDRSPCSFEEMKKSLKDIISKDKRFNEEPIGIIVADRDKFKVLASDEAYKEILAGKYCIGLKVLEHMSNNPDEIFKKYKMNPFNKIKKILKYGTFYDKLKGIIVEGENGIIVFADNEASRKLLAAAYFFHMTKVARTIVNQPLCG